MGKNTAATRSLTAWIVDLGIRVTLSSDGVFRTLRGFEPVFDPTTVTYVTDRAVGNLAAIHGIRISGDTVSVARLTDALAGQTKHRTYTLAEICEHKYLGKTADLETILAAYGEDVAVAA